MVRRKAKAPKLTPKVNKNIELGMEKVFEQSIKKLKANERDIERAIKKVLTNEEIKISEAEYNELKRLTDTLNEIDKVIEDL